VDLLGARVEQYYALDTTVPVSGDWGSGEDKIWAEQIGSLRPGTAVLMRYGKSNGWLDGQPAVVTRKVGNGNITYVGASLDEETMTRAARWVLSQSGVAPVLQEVPKGVDVAVRSGEGKRILILTNYNAEPETVTLPTAMEDVLSGGSVSKVNLPQYGVAVLRAR
jgi:beta-galactosidase